jgi:hypothetical protein
MAYFIINEGNKVLKKLKKGHGKRRRLAWR